MATTARELKAAIGDMSVEDMMTGFEQGLIYQGYDQLLHDELWNLMMFKTPQECGADANNSLIFNTVTTGLSSVGARAIGKEYTPDNSKSEIHTFQMTAYGGAFQVDRAIMRAQRMDMTSMNIDQIPNDFKTYLYRQFRSKMDAIIEGFNSTFISGNGTAPNWKGLEAYVTAGSITPQTITLPEVLTVTGAQLLWRKLNTMCARARTNTLVVNSVGYQLLCDLMFLLHINNSMQKIGEVQYEGISGMTIVTLPDECFTSISKGSGTGVIYALRIGKGERDFGIAVPNDGKVLDVVNPFSPAGAGVAVREGLVELVGCIYPGIKDSVQLLQITVTPAASGYTDVNLVGVGSTDVNIAAVGGTPVTAALPVQAANGSPVQVIVRDATTPGAFLSIENGAVPTTIKNGVGETLGTPTNPMTVKVDQTTNPVMKVSLTDQGGENPYNPSDGLPVRQTADAVPVAVKSMDQRISVGVKNDPRDPVLKTVVADSTGQQTANVADGKLSVNSVT